MKRVVLVLLGALSTIGCNDVEGNKAVNEKQKKNLIVKEEVKHKNTFYNSRIKQQLFDAKQVISDRPIASEDKLGIVKIDKENGLKVRILKDVHMSPKAYKYLEDILKEFQDADPSKTLFIVEGLSEEKNIMQGDKLNRLVFNIAKEADCKIINPIKNLSKLKVLENVFAKVQQLNPSINKEAVIGFLIDSSSKSLKNGRLEIDVFRSVNHLHNKTGNNVSIKELYEASEATMDFGPDQVNKLGMLFGEFFTQNPDITLDDLNCIDGVIELANQKGVEVNRKHLLGFAVNHCANLISGLGEYRDIGASIKDLIKIWSKDPNFKEFTSKYELSYDSLHKAYVNYLMHGSQEQSIAINQEISNVQDEMTTKALKEQLKLYPNVKNIMVVTGYKHVESVEAAFE